MQNPLPPAFAELSEKRCSVFVALACVAVSFRARGLESPTFACSSQS